MLIVDLSSILSVPLMHNVPMSHTSGNKTRNTGKNFVSKDANFIVVVLIETAQLRHRIGHLLKLRMIFLISGPVNLCSD